jgi:hypothetical protein
MKNGVIRWKNKEVSKRFTVTSLRETCTSCAIYFNSAQAFKEHMVSEHVDILDSVFSSKDRYAIFSAELIHQFNFHIVARGGGKPAPNEDPSLDVLKKMNDANEVMEVSDEESKDEDEEVFEFGFVDPDNNYNDSE